MEPSDLLEITAAKSGLGPGVSIQLYTLHGGLIDGQVQTTLLTDEQGAVQFTFQLGPASGNYPLILRCRGREEALDFWVRSPGDSLLATNSPSGCGNPPQPPSPCGECPEEESPCPCGSGSNPFHPFPDSALRDVVDVELAHAVGGPFHFSRLSASRWSPFPFIAHHTPFGVFGKVPVEAAGVDDPADFAVGIGPGIKKTPLESCAASWLRLRKGCDGR